MNRTYSVSVRLQRVITETAHVSVPVSEELLQPNPDGSGTYKIDADKLMARAVELGKNPSMQWSAEGEVLVTLHPFQTPPE